MLRRDIDRDHVPAQPGVYKFLSKGESILYIGKAKNLKKRLQQYFSPGSVRKQDMVKKARRVEWLPTTTDQEALMLEIQLITTHTPFYNNLIKGTTAYVYIKIQHGPFPLISLTRYRNNDKHIYIGPKLRKRDLKQVLQTLRQLFQRRSCNQTTFNKGVVCSDYFFGLCKGRCAYHRLEKSGTGSSNEKIGFSQTMSTEKAHDEYDQIIKVLGQFFRGRHKPLQQYLYNEIQHAVTNENYERAARLRDMYTIVESVTEKQTVVLDRPHGGLFVCIEHDERSRYRSVVTLEEGRIIDVITGHELLEDSSLYLLVAAIEREFEKELTVSSYFDRTYYNLSDQRISKNHQRILMQHAHTFIEGYKTSRLQQDSRAFALHLLEQMQKRFHVHTLPIHIECLDISHFSGDWTAGAISGMYYGKIQKNMYRRYKIRYAEKHDDYGALKEVLRRRFLSRQASAPPDFFVIDGGKGQLGVIDDLKKEHAARDSICQVTTFVSLGKGEARSRKGKQQGNEECLFYKSSGFVKQEPLIYDEVDKLLVKLRDEAHRFANQYRKKLQSGEYSS